MKAPFLSLLLGTLMAFGTSDSSQPRFALDATKLNASPNVLKKTEPQDLSFLSNVDFQGLQLRLYAVPLSGACTPQGNATCWHHYYLTVGQQTVETVFDLGVVGELTFQGPPIKPFPNELKPSQARLGVKASGYALAAIKENAALANAGGNEYMLDISVDDISIWIIDY